MVQRDRNMRFPGGGYDRPGKSVVVTLLFGLCPEPTEVLSKRMEWGEI
jgi:hypothetical protein